MSSQKRRRILYVEAAPGVGGSTLSLFELVCGLDAAAYEPVVLFYYPSPYVGKFRERGIRVVVLNEHRPAKASAEAKPRDIAATLGRYGGWLATAYRHAKEAQVVARKELPTAWRITQVLRTERADLLHSNNTVRGSRVTGIAARMARVPHVCHVRMFPTHAPFEESSHHLVDAYIYISQAVAKECMDLGIPANRGRVIYNPVNAKTFAAAARRDRQWDVPGLSPENYVISNVGRVSWWKGHEYFIQAIAEIIRQEPDVRALIVGACDETYARDLKYYEQLKWLVRDLDVEDHVTFTGFRWDVADIMARSDLIVHSASEPEPFGRVVVEAMMAGTPIIATAAGGVPEIVRDGVTGCLVPPKDVDAMAQAIRYLKRQPDAAAHMCRMAQQEAIERFSVEQHVEKVQSLYHEVLS